LQEGKRKKPEICEMTKKVWRFLSKFQKSLDKHEKICYNLDLIRVPERPSPYRAKNTIGTVESP
jgi:hypothetical protein